MMNTAQRWMVTCLVSSLFVGCGGGSSTDESGGAATMTPTTKTGTGTTSPSTGAAGGGAAGMVPGMTSVMCGTATCQGFMFMGMGATPCCDMATTSCGTMQGGMCVPNPAVAPACPKITVFGRMVNACCKPDNTCGVDGSALGQGCSGYSMLMSLGVTPPPPTMCDGTPVPGGATMAGGAAGSSAGAAGAKAGAAGASAGAAGASAAMSGAAGGGAKATAGTGAATSGAAGASSAPKAGAGGR